MLMVQVTAKKVHCVKEVFSKATVLTRFTSLAEGFTIPYNRLHTCHLCNEVTEFVQPQ